MHRRWLGQPIASVTAILLVTSTATSATAVSASSQSGFRREADAGAASIVRRPSQDDGRAVAVQRDGKIIVAGISHVGTNADFALARYRRDGRLDPHFGTRGLVLTNFGSDGEDVTWPSALPLQADGKILLAGWTASDRDVGDFALARYTRDGRLDRSFGKGGKVVTDFGSNSDDGAYAIAVQSDGKIVLGGSTSRTEDAPNDWALVRYTANGRLDRSFGVRGKVRTDFGTAIDAVGALAIQGDGKIVAAGEGASDFALARYLQDGTLDPSFGAAGKVLTDFASRDSEDGPSALVIQRDGKIVAGGTSADDRSDDPLEDFVLVRYTPDGRLDESFGQAGIALTDFGADDEAWALALQRDGKIVASGDSGILAGSSGDFALARYTIDGTLDPSFGAAGKVLTGFGSKSSDSARGVALEADGRIVAAGVAERARARGGDFALARYAQDGRLDRRFGRNGRVVTDFAVARTRIVSLSATRTSNGVRVRWRTAGEVGTRAFNVYRYAKNAPRVRVNRKPLRAEGSATRGATYSILDRRTRRTRAVEYWVEDVRRSGERVPYGPIAVKHRVTSRPRHQSRRGG